MDFPKIGGYVRWQVWNGIVTNTCEWANGEKGVEILFAKNVFKGQKPERYDWSVVKDVLQPSTPSDLWNEINQLRQEQYVRLTEAFPGIED
jgi:hypothetical protein